METMQSAAPEQLQQNGSRGLTTTHASLSDPLWCIHEAVFMFATCCLLKAVIPPISRYLFPKRRVSLPEYMQRQWDMRIVSVLYSTFICIIALGIIANDPERTHMTNFHGRLWGYSKSIGAIGGYSLGYYLWELFLELQNIRSASRDTLLHSIPTLVLLSLCYIPFLQFYVPWALLFQISTPFLHIHWFCDVLGMTGSIVQLLNGCVLLSTFFWSRIVWGNYQSFVLYKDLWSAYSSNHSSHLFGPEVLLQEHEILPDVFSISLVSIDHHSSHFPPWLLMLSFFSAAGLNTLNFWWFYKLIHSMKRRFILAKPHGVKGVDKASKKQDRDRAGGSMFVWLWKIHVDLLLWYDKVSSMKTHIIAFSTVCIRLPGHLISTMLCKIAERVSITPRRTPSVAVAPLTEVEVKMQKLWADILGMDIQKIAAKDHFFRLGGDSVQAVMLQAAAQAQGLQVTVADIFAAPTLSGLSHITTTIETPTNIDLMPFELLNGREAAEITIEEAATTCSIEKDTIEDSYPCTPLQEALMTLSIGLPGAYVARHVIHLQLTLDLDLLRVAWETVVVSSPILRTRIIQPSSSPNMVQVVIRENPSWESSSNLHAYLEDDNQVAVNFGERLNRCAIVDDVNSAQRYLVWTMHHAIYDGWSLSLIIRDIVRVYQGAMIPNPTKFNHFVKFLAEADGDAARAYWQAQLSGSQPSTYPAVLDAGHDVRVDSSYSHLICLSQTTMRDFTTATIIRGAWALLMGMYENASSVVIGVTLAGRNAAMFGIEEVVGPTIATMPVCIDINPRQTINRYLEKLQKQATAMIPFEQYGLRNIKAINADTQIACEFQNLLLIHSTTWSRDISAFGTIEEHSKELVNDKTYPLVMECMLTADGIQVRTSFDSRIVDRLQAAKVVGQFEHVLRQIHIKDGTTTIGRIDMISQNDHTDIWVWNSRCPDPLDACVHEVVAQQIATRPDALAVNGWDVSFKYRELDRLSTLLAHYLINLGVGPGEFVPLCFEKSAWMVVAMLGVLKAGGACAALDPRHPIERLQTMITDLEAEIIVSSSANVDLLKRIANTIVVVDSSSPFLLLEESQDPLRKEWRKAQSCDAAFVVFTSGSTGKPKGIVVEHTAFCTSAREHGAALQLGIDSRVLQFAAYTFDVSLGEMFTTLIHGGCICIPSEEDRLNDLAGVIQRMKVNWACLAPSVANLLFPAEVPSLKTLALSGEAATRVVVTRWADTVRLVNIYGPAECSIWSAYSSNLNKDTSPTNIGQGVGSVLWVAEVTNHERLVPIGCIGELLIEGPILARGYLNNQEKTTEAFIENPPWAEHFGPSRPKRFYKTGDLVCYNSNGTINYVGRKDTQVKLHGQRLELGEIEHHILSNVQVINAMVMLPTKGHSKGQLVAIIAFRESTSDLQSSLGMSNDKKLRLVDMNRKKWTANQISHIREHLSSRLPVYMLPALWMIVEAMPLNTSGKLDRVRVRRWVEEMDEEMYRRGVDINAEVEESKELITATHQQLQKVLAKVLNLPEDRIMLNQSFQSLGGDSITAMQVVARARTEGITIRVKDILQSRNILQLISVAKSGQLTSPLEENERTLGDFPLLPLTYADLERIKNEMRGTVGAAGIEEAEGIYHCTPMQQALLLGQSRMPGTYKLAYMFEVVSTQPGTCVNVNKLLSAWQSVVQRHTILRTVFVDGAYLDISFEDGPFVQLVLHRVAPRTICQPIAKNDTEALASLMRQDLVDYHEAMPPHQLTICQTALGNVFCKLEISHAINDGTSTKIMLRDLNLAYHGKLSKSPAMPYRNYVKYLQDWAQDSGMQFWRERLADVKPCVFPVLRDQNQGAKQLKVVDLDLDLKPGQLEALCNAAGVTVSTILTTVWGLVLRYYTSSDDVCFGYLTSGRDIALHGIEDAVGPFINMLVCYMQIKPTSRLTDVLVQRQAEYLEALGYQHYSLARIQHELKLPSRQMFNTAISIQSKTSSHTEEEASLMFREIGGEDPVEYDIMLHGSVSISEANVSLGYWSSICTHEQAANIASTFTKILHYVLEGHEFLAELNLLSGSDKKQKWEWKSLRNKTLDACDHNVVTQQITARADSPAVKGWDAGFKNQEIDEETHQRSVVVESEESKELITTMHQRLQRILTKVLNLPEERIILNRSFLSLGGDSITAMQFVAQARKEGIVIRVQDVLQNRNILEVASVAKTKSGQQTSPLEEYELDTIFDVSPIQQMYFNLEGQVANQPNHHFNQSFLLRLVREFPGSDLTRVIEAVVRQHLMLRARFRQVKDGQWGQLISSDISGSYRFDIYDITDQAEMMASLAVIQASLNIEEGPVFAGAAFNIAGSGQVLFLVAHHLVIDLVSWRVILQDIEELLDSGVPSAVIPLSFQKWCRLQTEHAQQHLLPEKVLPFAVVPADNAYWGMANQADVYGDLVSESFVIDVETTAMLLENCNTALGTESVEIFLATMIHSFNQIFTDRPVPTIFNEGHGREPWDSDIDLSRTVGWFTTITPLHVPVLAGMNLIDVIRRTKDIRRKLPGNGLPYFASRFLTAEGADAFGDHLSMEILFNYLGRYQQLERNGGLLRQEPRPAGTAVSDVGSDVQRLALLEISAVIMHGSVHFQCVYNRKMQHQLDIIRWMRAWEQSLREAVRILPRMNVERTLSDFPLLPTSMDQETFQGILTAINSRLPGQTADAIEGISTCTNLQSMMLESMDDCSIKYRVSDIFKVEDARGNVNLDRLKQAWSSVLTSHTALRTIFAKYSFKDGTQFLQVILKAHVPRINIVDAQSGDQALKLLKNIQSFRLMPFNEGPPYQLTIVQCRGRGAVWVRFDICHAILDATSLQIIKRDVGILYNLDSEPQPLLGSSFLPFVKANLPCETSDTLHYWTKYLEGSRPTIVQPLQHSVVGAQQSMRSLSSHSSISICIANLPLLRASCRFYNATISNLVNAAWSIVLHHNLMGQQDICFGYLVSARDVTLIPNVESAVGPHLNLLLQRVLINGNTTLITVLHDIARHSAAHLTHQGCGSDAEYLPRNGNQKLFNTMVNYRKVLIPRVTNESGSSLKHQKSNLSMEVIESSDPWNFDIVAEIADDDESIIIDLVYWTDLIDSEVAKSMAKLFHGLIEHVAQSPQLTVSEALSALESTRFDF